MYLGLEIGWGEGGSVFIGGVNCNDDGDNIKKKNNYDDDDCDNYGCTFIDKILLLSAVCDRWWVHSRILLTVIIF